MSVIVDIITRLKRCENLLLYIFYTCIFFRTVFQRAVGQAVLKPAVNSSYLASKSPFLTAQLHNAQFTFLPLYILPLFTSAKVRQTRRFKAQPTVWIILGHIRDSIYSMDQN